MAKDFNLQILHHNEVFATNQEALSYISTYLKPISLVGQPAVVFYGDEAQPNAILCIGSGKYGKVYTVDFQAVKEEIDKISQTTETEASDIADAVAKIEGILKAVELSCNKIDDEWVIQYNPDPTDEVIGTASTIAEALQLLSEYAQNSQIYVGETNSVSLNKENGIVTANVKISTLGKTSVTSADDNILGVFPDGLYAVANLNYDADKNVLTFITSGYDENGIFKRDANTEVIELGKHTQYEEYNKGHNIEVAVDNDKMQISADAKISENDNNILETKKDGLFVGGKASNIKYHKTTVLSAINDLYDKVSEAGKNTEYIDSDTIKFTTKTDANNELNVTADVKLSNDESIIISNGGLSVDLSISVNSNNKLVVKLGNTTKRIDLPGIEIIDHIEFDNGNLIIWYNEDKYVTIPLEGLIAHYKFENNAAHFVVFETTIDDDGVYHIYATVKLRSSDNLISHNSSGELFVSQEVIQGLITTITDTIEANVKTLQTNVETLKDTTTANTTAIEQLQKDVATNTTNIQTNTDAISAIQTQMATDETSLKAIQAQVETNTANISANTTNIADIKTQIATDENKFSTLSEQVNTNVTNIKKNADDISALQNEVKAVKNDIEEDEEKLSSIESDVKEVEGQVATNTQAISTLNTTVSTVQGGLTNEVTRAEEAEASIETEIETINTKLAKKIETVVIEKVDNNNLQYQLLVDGTNAGYINIPEDAFLKSVTYDKSINALVFDFLVKKDDGTITEEVVNIPISDMVSNYTSGNGITIENNVVSIHINNAANEKDADGNAYLSLTEDGLALLGINEALALKADQADVEKQVNELSGRISTLEKTKYTPGNGIDITDLTISTKINDDANIEGYLKIGDGGLYVSGVDSAIATAVATEESRAKQAEEELSKTISSVANEICAAGDGLKKVDVEGGHQFNVHINSNSQTYLTVDEDGLNLSGVAGSDELSAVDERVKTIESDYATSADIDKVQAGVTTNTENIKTLSDAIDANKFHTANTTTAELTMAESIDLTRELSAKVKISNADGNIIKDDDTGIYAKATLKYDTATNTLTFNNGGDDQTFNLTLGETLLKNGYFDTTSGCLILVVEDASGKDTEISIPLTQLIDFIVADNDNYYATNVILGTDTYGKQTIGVQLILAEGSDNALSQSKGGLYVSNQASNMYCYDSATGTQITIQQAISTLETQVATNSGEIGDLEKGVVAATTEVVKDSAATHLTITSTTGTGGQAIYTIGETDIASNTTQQNIIGAVGLNSDGTYSVTTGSITSTARTIAEAISLLEQQILADEKVANVTAADKSITVTNTDTGATINVNFAPESDNNANDMISVTDNGIEISNVWDCGEY